LLSPGGEKGGALHRADLRADADGPEKVRDLFAQRRVRRERREVARVEPVRIARLDEELLGARGIVRWRVDGQRELERRRHERARRPTETEHLGLVDGLAVDGEARGQAYAAIVPRRFRLPLVE